MSASSRAGRMGFAPRGGRSACTDGAKSEKSEVGPWVQVSRLGSPLFNEVIIPLGLKDEWNARQPVADSTFLSHVQKPELSGLLPVLYPGVFPGIWKNWTNPRPNGLTSSRSS